MVDMADRDILERIDTHMARGNELMTRGNELMERIEIEFQLNRETYTSLLHDLRDHTSALMTRFDRNMLRIDRRMASHEAETRDLRAESRAQTQALLRRIDRMDRLDPGGATA
jgi:hypothetical protein